MARTGNRQRRTRAQWQALVAAYEASGESQRAFCAEHGVALSTLRHWKDRQAGTAWKAAPAVARLVAIEMIEEPAAGSGVVVVAGNGVRIEVAAGFDGATLKRVLATLGAGA
jgi:hypothetical protein